MIRLANAQLWVDDQEEALSFYTDTLGWEVRSDVSVPEWNFRWLVVGPVGQTDVGLVLMAISAMPVDDDAKNRLREIVASGIGGPFHQLNRRRRRELECASTVEPVKPWA